MSEPKSIAIVGAGIFGLSLAVALRNRNYKVTVFDRNSYDESGYDPDLPEAQAASVDHNKIFRASYGTKIHYQRLAVESRKAWDSINEEIDRSGNSENGDAHLFHSSGMLRVQPTDQLGALEKETLANMERDGLRHTQFVKSNSADRQRARELGWESKLLDFEIPDASTPATFEAVLDSLAGFIRCSNACAYFQRLAAAKGVAFLFGPEAGAVNHLVEEETQASGPKKAVGLKTKDGVFHKADIVVVAAGSFSTQLLHGLAYHLESSAGSLATFEIDRSDTSLWDKYSPEQFPVITWKNVARSKEGTDTGSIYVLPRTPEGLVKIGFRGIKFTNFEPAPNDASFAQDGQWSVPLSPAESVSLPERATDAIKAFVSIFLPEFDGLDFHSTRLCWYTDSLDNSFVVDYVPTYADKTVFVCTGGSGHGAKFLPVLGEHAADILERGEQSSSYMREYWRWRDDVKRGNGLEEGPEGPRNIGG